MYQVCYHAEIIYDTLYLYNYCWEAQEIYDLFSFIIICLNQLFFAFRHIQLGKGIIPIHTKTFMQRLFFVISIKIMEKLFYLVQWSFIFFNYRLPIQNYLIQDLQNILHEIGINIYIICPKCNHGYSDLLIKYCLLLNNWTL